MKKHLVIAFVIFGTITTLSLASNFINWDETPLEQTIFPLPLIIGFVLEMPFLGLMGFLVGGTTSMTTFHIYWIIIPFITGAFYAGFYYLMVFLTKFFLNKRPPNTVA